MSSKELERVELFSLLKQKRLKQSKVAEILGLCLRQVKRLFKAYKQFGAPAFVSKKVGMLGNNRLKDCVVELVVGLIKEKYVGFGPTLAYEKLIEDHNLNISVGSVRNIMIANGLWETKKYKQKRIYQLRERRSRLGELVQMDGSPHDWFEGRSPKCTIIYCIDDATGKILSALFAPTEAMWSYFELMQNYIKMNGRPVALYVDKHGVFRVNKPNVLGGQGITQFGRAMKELEIEIIYANSPQAKGRIEKCNGTLQDRLVKEMRLHNISTMKQANIFLPSFLEKFNKRFAVVPKEPHNAHRALLSNHNLEDIFVIKEFRYLSKNLTLQYQNTIYQIKTERESYAMRNAKVILHEKKDGSIKIYYKGKKLLFTTYNEQQKQGEIVDSKQLNYFLDHIERVQNRAKQKPSLKHPWR